MSTPIGPKGPRRLSAAPAAAPAEGADGRGGGSQPQGPTSTRPYLIRALHEWCTDNGYTPYLAVSVDGSVQVPPEYVRQGEIVLNVGFAATSGLQLGNEWIEFKARFGGVARDIVVPISHVVAIYAAETGDGMAFSHPGAHGATPVGPASAAATPGEAKTGLRLADAPSGESPTGEGGDDEPPPDGSTPPASSPTPPSTAPTGRPALKRIK